MEQSERASIRNLQKEQEREKRRLRDRQRRQSMSVEEREKHLARRRRNYQLRRQRAEVARLDLQTNPSIATNDEILMLPSNEYHEVASISSSNNLCNEVVPIPTDQRQQSMCATMTKTVALEVPANKLSQLPKRPLLNHIKRLARSLHAPVDVVENQKIEADLILQGQNATSSCIPPKKLRLNHVKRIARALNSDVAKTADADDQSKTGDTGLKDIPEELKTFSANNDGGFFTSLLNHIQGMEFTELLFKYIAKC
ncbi:hypothetical protein K2173_017981 [Erythroxylum novogranatense]|uniref:Uncharacterized protein n=1 Tax=Erythroxylum novogranatense TaxID=1862640 RepID=A0AAV8TXB8_9ROSI|nr:hypothetical protein K2173_017981 [Erythroxylum novogranatense]